MSSDMRHEPPDATQRMYGHLLPRGREAVTEVDDDAPAAWDDPICRERGVPESECPSPCRHTSAP